MASDVKLVREMQWRMEHESWLSSHTERLALVTVARAVAGGTGVEDHLLRSEMLRQHAA